MATLLIIIFLTLDFFVKYNSNLNYFNSLTEYSQEARKNMAFNETIDVITKSAIQILPYGIIVDMIILELILTLKWNISKYNTLFDS